MIRFIIVFLLFVPQTRKVRVVLKLLYQSTTHSSQTSPFDDAIVQASKGNPIKIVSPYIGLRYLKRLIGISSSWKLVSDVDEWLAAAPRNERLLIHDFLDVNRDQVRHYSGVHAKTVIGPLAAYVGSANLTLRGLLSRVELGFRVETTEHLDELHYWFDELWSQAAIPDMNDVQQIIDHLNLQPNRLDNKKVFTVGASIRSTRASLVQLERRNTQKSDQVWVLNSKKLKPEFPEAEEPIVQSPITRARFTGSDHIEELHRYIDMYATSGFSFNQALAHFRSRGLRITAVQLYFDILPFCANRIRSVFSIETVNRLIYRDGKFIQSNKQLLESALTPFDAFLRSIVRRLDFKEIRLLELGKALIDIEEISDNDQRILLESLLENKFLIEKSGFRLNESWQWTSRFKLFAKSYHDWETKHRLIMLYRAEAAGQIKTVFPAPQVESKTAQIDEISDTGNSEDNRIHYIRSNLVRQNYAHTQAMLNIAPSSIIQHESLKNNELDEMFAQLCNIVSSNGVLLRMSMKQLIDRLKYGRALQKKDISSAISGNLRFKSPLIVRTLKNSIVVEPGNQSRIVLDKLPKTANAIFNTPACQSGAPKIIKASSADHDALKEILEKADSDYLAMCQAIEVSKWGKKLNSEKNLLSFSGQNIPLQHTLNIQKLLLKAPKNFPHLFRITNTGKNLASIVINRDYLWKFPLTKAYITSRQIKTSAQNLKSPQNSESQNLTGFVTQSRGLNSTKIDSKQIKPSPKNQEELQNSDFESPANLIFKAVTKLKNEELKDKADQLFARLVSLAMQHGNPIFDKNTKASRMAIGDATTTSINLNAIILKSRRKIQRIIDIDQRDGVTTIIYNQRYFAQLKNYPLTNELMKTSYPLLKNIKWDNQEDEIQD